MKISSNVQKRNLLVLKVKKDSNGTILDASTIGVIEKCHVFRDLFDFTAESEFETRLLNELKSAAEDFDESKIENIHKILSESEIDLSTFSIPPYKFSHINLPLSSRDIRSNLKVLSSCFYNCPLIFYRFPREMIHQIKKDRGTYLSMNQKSPIHLPRIV